MHFAFFIHYCNRHSSVFHECLSRPFFTSVFLVARNSQNYFLYVPNNIRAIASDHRNFDSFSSIHLANINIFLRTFSEAVQNCFIFAYGAPARNSSSRNYGGMSTAWDGDPLYHFRRQGARKNICTQRNSTPLIFIINSITFYMLAALATAGACRWW